jgi:hypothetical protein
MNLRDRVSFAAIFWFVAFAATSGVCLFQYRELGELKSRHVSADDDILINDKVFFDMGDGTNAFVSVRGALTGDGVGYRNNSMVMSCFRAYQECYYSMLSQVGPGQIAGPDPVSILKVTEWNKHQITATSTDADVEAGCGKLTVNIDRIAKEVEWVQEPINQSALFCKKSDGMTYKWFVDSPPSLKKLFNGR